MKEKEAVIGRRIASEREEMLRIRHQRTIINAAMEKMLRDRRYEINQFMRDNMTDERKLADVSDWCLVNELVARGFGGTLTNDEKGVDFMAHLNEKLQRDTIIAPPQYCGTCRIAA